MYAAEAQKIDIPTVAKRSIKCLSALLKYRKMHYINMWKAPRQINNTDWTLS